MYTYFREICYIWPRKRICLLINGDRSKAVFPKVWALVGFEGTAARAFTLNIQHKKVFIFNFVIRFKNDHIIFILKYLHINKSSERIKQSQFKWIYFNYLHSSDLFLIQHTRIPANEELIRSFWYKLQSVVNLILLCLSIKKKYIYKCFNNVMS